MLLITESNNYSPKSPQVVKHVVKGEKWACSTQKTGKNKPFDYVAKTRDFARIREKIKENSEVRYEPPILV